MTPNEHFSQMAAETGMSPFYLAEVLQINYDTLLKVFNGKLVPKEGLVGDLVQVLEDIAFWKAHFAAQPDSVEHYEAMRDYRIKKSALDSLKESD
jgi:hypothetical protein